MIQNYRRLSQSPEAPFCKMLECMKHRLSCPYCIRYIKIKAGLSLLAYSLSIFTKFNSPFTQSVYQRVQVGILKQFQFYKRRDYLIHPDLNTRGEESFNVFVKS